LKKIINVDFKPLEKVDSIQKVIEDIFSIKLDISGVWGYDNNSVVIVNSLDMPIEQFVNLFASIRANIEMNLTLEEDERFGGINVTLQESKEFKIANKNYDVVTFKITAINEKTYANFIKEYKENYGKKEFDLEKHFKKRKEKTVVRVMDYWFYGLKK